jgi:hypothetical protein
MTFILKNDDVAFKIIIKPISNLMIILKVKHKTLLKKI